MHSRREARDRFSEVARAAGVGTLKIARILSSAGENDNDDTGTCTVLLCHSILLEEMHRCAGFRNLIRTLVAGGVNLEARIGRKRLPYTVFEIACAEASAAIVRFLCSNCTIQSSTVYKDGILAALITGRDATARYLLKERPEYRDEVLLKWRSFKALHEGEDGEEDCDVEDKDVHQSEDGAADNERGGCSGSDHDDDDETEDEGEVLHNEAVEEGDWQKMFVHAVKTADFDLVRWLAEKHEYDLDAPLPKNRRSPIHFAAVEEKRAMCKCLHELGANLELPHPTNGNTPLHMACAAGHLDVVSFLVRMLKITMIAFQIHTTVELL
jgi:ankyrin repeat protein